MVKGFQRHGVQQSDAITAERVRITLEYRAVRGCSLRRAAKATGWYDAAVWRRAWRRLSNQGAA
jgi:hypothetical protein